MLTTLSKLSFKNNVFSQVSLYPHATNQFALMAILKVHGVILEPTTCLGVPIRCELPEREALFSSSSGAGGQYS